MTAPAPIASARTGTLSDREIKELAGAGALITGGFDPQFVQQACYELRASTVFYQPDEGGRRHEVQAEGDILIKPKQLMVIITMETLDLPADVLGRVLLKGKMFSIGLIPVNTYADPGFSGRLGIVLFNAGNNYLRIRPGDPIAKLELSRLAEPVSRPYRGQHGYQTGIWPLVSDMVVTPKEAARDPRVGPPVDELTRAYGHDMGQVITRIYRFERRLLLSGFAYMLFSVLLIAVTQTSRARQLSIVGAVFLGVVSNLVTSVLTIAATRLRGQTRRPG
jgi:dCTP deaminase